MGEVLKRELRRRFLADPSGVLNEFGLPELAAGLGRGKRALLTLELRESRSSLAGVMVAAAAEAVDFAHVAERAAPDLAHNLGRAVDHLSSHSAPPASHPSPPAPAKPDLAPSTSLPPMAASAPASPAPSTHLPSGVQPPQTPAGSQATAGQSAPAPAPAGAQPPAPRSPAPGPQASGALAPTAGKLGAPHPEGSGTGHPSHHPVDQPHHPVDPSHPSAVGGGPGVDPLPYPGDGAAPQQIAAWMGAHAVRAGLPAELPVMAALTESGMRNLSYGDRDSVGFFQMRVGIWNQGPYLGYPQNPELQIQWFIDHALAARAQYPGLAQNPNTWGEWVANVEQPAAEYRYRYQLELATAQELLRGVNLTPAPPPPPIPVGQAALNTVLHQLRTPAPGSASLGTSFDSPGLVQYAYAREGINLPRVAAEQFDIGAPVSRHDLRLGDAVFFADRHGLVHQVGLYVGSGRFISSPDGGGPVKISSLSDPHFAGEYAGARRYTLGALGDPKHYARSMPTVGP